MERDVLEPKDWRVDMLVKERRADTRPQVEPERRSHPVHHLLSFLEKPSLPSAASLEEAASRWWHRQNERKSDLPTRVLEEGLLLDVHGMVLAVTEAGDVFKGMALLLFAASQVVRSVNSPPLSGHSGLLCNLALFQCYPGIMLAQGYSSYERFLREWPDPVTHSSHDLISALLLPLISAWMCELAFYLLDPAVIISGEALKQVILGPARAGEGSEMLLACSLNFGCVYLFWRPVSSLLQSMKGHRLWHDGFALCLAFSPLALMVCSTILEEHAGKMKMVPYLLHFHVGILLAASWDRFLSELRPFGSVTDSIHVLPWEIFGAWLLRLASAWSVAFLLFVPLGQVALVEDLSSHLVHTNFGALGSPDLSFPSPLWVVALLWPLAVALVICLLLVALHRFSTVLRCLSRELNHVGRNFLYYMVVLNIFLASQQRKHVQRGVGLAKCLLAALGILAVCRFIHFVAGISRKAVRA